MRIFGWVFGGVLLANGLLALALKRDVIKAVHSSVGRKLPQPVSKTLRKASDVNDVALRAMGINNVLAGTGMLVVSTLLKRRHRHFGRALLLGRFLKFTGRRLFGNPTARKPLLSKTLLTGRA